MPRDDSGAKGAELPRNDSAAPGAVASGPGDVGAAGAVRDGAWGLLLTPVVAGIAALALRRARVSPEIADVIVFAGAASMSVAALLLAARWYPAWKWRLALGISAVTVLAVLAFLGAESATAAIAVDTMLVAVAWAIGTSIGRRIEHPGHLLPACVVVACADATSIVSRFGPTHAIAESERALSIVAVAFPVPGTFAFAPTLGVGDLVFVAIVLGAAGAHRLSMVRAAICCWLGMSIAGVASALLETAVPALVPIGAAVVLGLPAARKLRPQDRRVATLAMAITVAVASAAIVAQLVHPATKDVAE